MVSRGYLCTIVYCLVSRACEPSVLCLRFALTPVTALCCPRYDAVPRFADHRYAVLRDDDLIEAISEWQGKKLVLQALQQR